MPAIILSTTTPPPSPDKTSSASWVGGVSVPFLAVHAEDDPLVSPEGVPVTAMVSNPTLTVVWTRWGGHIGWGEGLLPSLTPMWAENLVVEWLKAKLDGQARVVRPRPAERPTVKHGGDVAAAMSTPTFAQNTQGHSNLPLLSRL